MAYKFGFYDSESASQDFPFYNVHKNISRIRNQIRLRKLTQSQKYLNIFRKKFRSLYEQFDCERNKISINFQDGHFPLG